MNKKIIPQEDIDNLENARKELWGFIGKTVDGVDIQNISWKMWKITHKKYEEIND